MLGRTPTAGLLPGMEGKVSSILPVDVKHASRVVCENRHNFVYNVRMLDRLGRLP